MWSCLQQLPAAIPGKAGSRGYNLRGEGVNPSSSIPPVPTLPAFQGSGLFWPPCPCSGINVPHPVQEQVLRAGMGAGMSPLGVTKPIPSAPAPSWAAGAPTCRQTPRARTAVSLPREHPRDSQPALPWPGMGHTHPQPCSLCAAICSSSRHARATSQGSAATRDKVQQGHWSLQVQ